MGIFISILLAANAISVAVAQSAYYQPQPTPRACSGDACVDPSGILRYQDTTLIRRDGKSPLYFRFSKGDFKGDGINVATSPSLSGPWHQNFTILGSGLKSDCATKNNADANRWAPEVHKIKGQYYLYYTIEQDDGSCFDQCVATSPSMDAGTWVDHGSMNLPEAPNYAAWRRIDGNLLANSSDPQGVMDPPYMAWGSFQYGLYGIELSSDYLSAKPGAQPTLLVADQKQQPTPNGNQSGNYTEGAYQLLHDDHIYLFYSRGCCCSGPADPVAAVYNTQVCRTSASTPQGPYYDKNGAACAGNGSYNRPGSIFLYSNNNDGRKASVWQPGSVGVINDPTEGLCMWYQYQDNTKTGNLGFGYNYLSWEADGWPILTAAR